MAHTVGVFHGDDLLIVVKVVQERRENLPACVEFIVTHKVRVVTLQSVQDERFVGFGNLQVRETAAIGEIQLSHDGLHGQARQLGVHLDVHRLVGLHSDNQLVTRDILENTRCDIAELNTDFGLLLIQGCVKGKYRDSSGLKSKPCLPFPAFRMKGTPSHLSFLMYATIAQNVGHRESLGTVSSSLYAGLLPSRDFPYWPMMTFLGSMGSMARKTRTWDELVSLVALWSNS